MAQKSKILIIGGTGYIGKFIVQASAKAGHPTFALVRESTASSPEKSQLIESFKSAGVTILYGDINDHENLVKAIKQVDIVICTVGSPQIEVQLKIIPAIKEAGNIKRFLPSEFGPDVDHTDAVDPAAILFKAQVKFRKLIKAEGIPHTFIVSNGFAGVFLAKFGQAGATAPPREKVVIIGEGNTKAIFVKEEDVANYTIKAAVDPRTLNKIVYMRPPGNIMSYNEIVSLWEKKIGKNLEKIYFLEDQILKKIQESPRSLSMILSVSHSAFVKGDATNFEIDPSRGVEASKLYPEVKHTTIDEYLDQFV